MKEDLELVLNEYINATTQDFTNHPVATIVRKHLPEKLYGTLDTRQRYKIKGSTGAGQWTKIPWVAIFDTLVTTSAQNGYYPVFLFREDMSGFYFSLNQGVTDIKTKYKRDAKQVLKIKAEDYRAQVGKVPERFPETVINLKSGRDNSFLADLYEAGNIFSKFYSRGNVPETSSIMVDVNEMLRIYEQLTYNEETFPIDMQTEYEESLFSGFENLQRFRFHKRIERNRQLAKKVKQLQGYTCKACGINFEDVYGDIGRYFIEAHHMTPLSELAKDKVKLDIRTDFTVLCSNCHSMIHKLKDPSNLNLLIDILRQNGL